MNPYPLLKEVPDKPLKNHQVAAVKMFVEKKFGALFIPTGLGKTRTILTILAMSRIERIIFVTKKNILYKIGSEVDQWTNYSWQVLQAENKKDDLTKQIVIVNYDILASVEEKLIKYGATAIVLDESHCIKTPSAVRTKAAMSIRSGIVYKMMGKRKVPYAIGQPIPYRFLLTGTSIAKGFEDWYTQYKFLDDNIMPKFMSAFTTLYCQTAMMHGPNRRMYPKLLGYINITESCNPSIIPLMERVRPYTFTVRKEDCLDLPPKSYDVIPLAMTDMQKKIYRDMKNESIANVGGAEALAKVYISRIGKLHQIANGFLITDDGEYRRIPGTNPKMEWLKEWLPDIIEDDKVTVWTNYIATGEMVRETLTSMGIDFAYVKRGMTPQEIKEQNDRFQNDPKCRVIACAVKVGNSGIDLFAGNWSVIIDCDEAYLDRSQLEDRTFRMGQEKKCNYEDVQMIGTVERRIIENLKGKKSLHDLSIDELKSIIETEE